MLEADGVLFTRVVGGELHAERLPDGSVAIYDERSKSVHSLNPSAAVAWEACAQGATVEQVRQCLERHAGSPVHLDVAWTAIRRLLEAELVMSDAPFVAPAVDLARRSALKGIGTLGALALPVVLTLTASEQRAFAQIGVSATTTARPTTVPPTTTTVPPTTTTLPPTTTTLPPTTTTLPPTTTTLPPTTTTVPPTTTTLPPTTTTLPPTTTTLPPTTTTPTPPGNSRIRAARNP